MKAENSLNLCKDYFNGFNDVYNHETVGKTFIGILKILSYIFIPLPLIFGGIYLKNKKITSRQSDIDNKIDTNQIQAIFGQVIASDNQTTPQKRLATYLVNKLINFERTDTEALERSRFEKGFRKLDARSQEDFFMMASDNECLNMALQWIPSDIRELNFTSGPRNPIEFSHKNTNNAKLFFEALPRFTQLEALTLDFSGVGIYSTSIDRDVQSMTLPGNNRFAWTPDPDFVYRDGYEYRNTTFPIVLGLYILREQVKKNPQLLWGMSLINFGIVGLGTELRGNFGTLNPQYAQNIISYFRKEG